MIMRPAGHERAIKIPLIPLRVAKSGRKWKLENRMKAMDIKVMEERKLVKKASSRVLILSPIEPNKSMQMEYENKKTRSQVPKKESEI